VERVLSAYRLELIIVLVFAFAFALIWVLNGIVGRDGGFSTLNALMDGLHNAVCSRAVIVVVVG
jgi:hypothetical protein